MCGSYRVPLHNLSKVLCFCLMFGVVPERLYNGYKRGGELCINSLRSLAWKE